jgi:hypothetical protein
MGGKQPLTAPEVSEEPFTTEPPTSKPPPRESEYFAGNVWTCIKSVWEYISDVPDWVVLIVHLPACVLIVVVMLRWVDGYKALDGSSPRYTNGRLTLGSNDVITILSVVLRLLETLMGIWATAILWKCAMVINTKASFLDERFDLKDARRWALKKKWSWPKFVVPQHMKIAIVLSIWLNRPQSYFGPVLEGALNWGSSSEFGGTASVQSGSPTSNFPLWRYVATNGLDRSAVSRAAAFVDLAWQNGTLANGNTTQGSRPCRHVVNEDQLPTGSTLHNVTMPYIIIHDISWPTLDAIPLTIQQFINNSHLLSVSNDSPLSYVSNPGIAVLFDPTNETLSLPAVLSTLSSNATTSTISTPVYPDSFMFSGTMAAVVQILKNNYYEPYLQDPFGLGHLNNNYSTGEELSVQAEGWIPSQIHTYLVVNFTVGVATSATSTYITSRVVEADSDGVDIQAGPWVKQALYMLPDVMSTVAIMNTTELNTWHNLINYTETLIRYSYLGAWDMLQRNYDENSTSLTATLLEPRLQASVSRARVLAWFFVNLLFTFSGVTVFILWQEDHEIADIKGPTEFLEKFHLGKKTV